MSDENPDFFELIKQHDRNWSLEERTPETIVENFELYGFTKRAQALDMLDDHMRTADSSNLRKYSQLTGMRRRLGEIHRTLGKVGR